MSEERHCFSDLLFLIVLMKVEDQRVDLCSLIHVYALGFCQFALMYTSVRKNSHSSEPQN